MVSLPHLQVFLIKCDHCALTSDEIVNKYALSAQRPSVHHVSRDHHVISRGRGSRGPWKGERAKGGGGPARQQRRCRLTPKGCPDFVALGLKIRGD